MFPVPALRSLATAALLTVAVSGCDAIDPMAGALPPADWATVSVGAGHACALARDGRLACWGANDRGQLGIGAVSTLEPEPVPIEGNLFRMVSAGDRHTCAVDLGGEAWCWGANESGQLGDGTSRDRSAPTSLSITGPFTSISAGGAHSCAVSVRGQALCWGANESGQAGIDTELAGGVLPTPVAGGAAFASVTAGFRHSCGVLTSGEARCWGANPDGRLGTASLIPSHTPVTVGGGLLFRDLDAGVSHTCGRDTQGRGWCWGGNTQGEVAFDRSPGIGSPFLRSDSTLAAIGAGDRWTCGLRSTGQYRCWGLRWDLAEPGDIVPASRDGWTPLGIDPRKTVVALGVGAHRACAVRADGGVECWGL